MTSPSASASASAIIVGGGLVGLLSALALSRTGWHVSVYEKLLDPRKTLDPDTRRAIHISLSARGIKAIEDTVSPALAAHILSRSNRLENRMLHPLNSKPWTQPLSSVPGEAIYTLRRSDLQAMLLEAVEEKGIEVVWGTRLLEIGWEEKRAIFQGPEGRSEVRFDLCVGADGTYSEVRAQMGRVVQLDFTRSYLSAAYVKLELRSLQPGQPALPPGCLHIFSRGKHAVLGFSNRDGSATGTLTLTREQWEALDAAGVAGYGDGEEHAAWFRALYPELAAMVEEKELRQTLSDGPRGVLQTVTCSQYHYSDRCVLLGDAACTMSPYLGLGLNVGLESLALLLSLVPTPSSLTSTALEKFTARRYPSLMAAHRISLFNFQAIMSGSTSATQIARRVIDFKLGQWLGKERWGSVQGMATFETEMAFEEVEKVEVRQVRVLWWIGVLVAMMGLGGVWWLCLAWMR